MTTPADTAQATTAILESGAVMLGAALLFVTLFRRLKLGATLGYIVAGALIGPQLLRLIKDPEQLTSVTDIGIALLLFIVGLELQPSRLWRLRKDIFGLGLAQVVLCGLAISGLLYVMLGLTPEAALAIGLPLALSSTAQVLPMLRSDNELNTPQGERAFSILLFQDLAIVPMITIIAAMARRAPDPSAPVGLALALYTVLAVIGLVLVGPLHSQSAFPPGRAARRTRAVHRRGPVHGHWLGRGHAFTPPLGTARSLCRGSDARQITLPARAGKRRRAVSLDPAWLVLPVGRDAARPQARRRSTAVRARARCRSDHHENCADHAPQPSVQLQLDPELPARAAAKSGR